MMKLVDFTRNAGAAAFAAAALAACSGGNSALGPGPVAAGGPESGLTILSSYRTAALTMAHFRAPIVRRDHGKSAMSPHAKKNTLVYVGDWGTNDVYVFSYPALSLVGTLTGFNAPYGMCTDRKGDVYITNYYGGTAVEYAHGGTAPINTYNSGGEPIGCSVDYKNGNLAVTSFSPGEVTVYPGGNPSSGTTYSDSSCGYQWTMGYDRLHNLIGIGEYTSIAYCALLSGSSSESTLSTSGITIHFPGGTQDDGEYIALGDQEAGGIYQTGVWRATLSGTTLTAVGSEITFTDTCYSDYSDVVNLFFYDRHQGVPPRHADNVIGPNLWCPDAGTAKVDIWAYPAGGSPITSFSSGLTEPHGAAVSIAK